MRRYFFRFSGISEGDKLDPEDAMEFADDNAARAAAELAARETLAERIKTGEQLDHDTIEAVNERGERLFVVSFDEILNKALGRGTKKAED